MSVDTVDPVSTIEPDGILRPFIVNINPRRLIGFNNGKGNLEVNSVGLSMSLKILVRQPKPAILIHQFQALEN